MLPASPSLCDQGINSICYNVDLCVEVIPPEEADVEQIDAKLVFDSHEGVMVESTVVHQNHGL